jgi:hypothetical protein
VSATHVAELEEKAGRYCTYPIRGAIVGQFAVPRAVRRVDGEAPRAQRDMEPLVAPVELVDGRRGVQLWHGLDPAFRGALKDLGHTVPPAAPPPLLVDHYAIGPSIAGPRNPQLLNFINSRMSGVIRAGSRVGIGDLISEVARYFAQQRIVAIVRGRVKKITNEIRSTIGNVAYCDGRNLDPGSARVVVATAGSLGLAGHREAHIVIVEDPLVGLGPDPLFDPCLPPVPGVIASHRANLMARLADTGRRLFGVVDRHYRPSPFEFARLCQMFGPDSIELPSISTVVRKVHVVWDQLKGGPVPEAAVTALDAKRQGVWDNGLLIRRVVRLAKTFSSGDSVTVRNHYPVLAEHFDVGNPLRVAILVEGVAQAERLARSLRNWLIVTQECGDFDRHAQFTGGIVTAAGARRIPTELVDVLVRVDCGPGLPSIPANWLETRYKAIRPLLLIDFALENYPLLRLWTRERREEYQRVGWPDLAEDADIAAYRRFRLLTGRKRR